MKFDYIKCHGSGNEFIMIDAVAHNMETVNLSELAIKSCDKEYGIGADGILLLVKDSNDMFGMRMFNPDGSEAEMCGNGIRCIARLAENYIGHTEFNLFSGGKIYPTARYAPIYGQIPTYGVEIGVNLWSKDFAMESGVVDSFIGKVIPQLHPTLKWSAISVGNPHLVAVVEKCDIDTLELLGERVKTLTDILPNGVNLSFVELKATNHIFVTTFERGAGITPSCGTAMTSSATAMALQGLCNYNTDIYVENRGGAVRCICSKENGLKTTLIGNASYIETGEIIFDGRNFASSLHKKTESEICAWKEFLAWQKR